MGYRSALDIPEVWTNSYNSEGLCQLVELVQNSHDKNSIEIELVLIQL